MRLFVESLNALNSGRMVGDWIAPLDYNEEDFLKRVEEVTKGADEKIVTDYENAPNCGEYPNLRHYWQLCHEIRLARHSVNTNDLIAYVHDQHINADIDTFFRALEMFENDQVMRYESVQDFVEHMARLDGIDEVSNKWQWHIDMESYRKELEDSYFFVDVKNGVLVAER